MDGTEEGADGIPGSESVKRRVRLARQVRSIAIGVTRMVGRPVSLWEIHWVIGQIDPSLRAAVERAAVDYVRISLSTASRRELERYEWRPPGVAAEVRAGGVADLPEYWGSVGGVYGPGWVRQVAGEGE